MKKTTVLVSVTNVFLAILLVCAVCGGAVLSAVAATMCRPEYIHSVLKRTDVTEKEYREVKLAYSFVLEENGIGGSMAEQLMPHNAGEGYIANIYRIFGEYYPCEHSADHIKRITPIIANVQAEGEEKASLLAKKLSAVYIETVALPMQSDLEECVPEYVIKVCVYSAVLLLAGAVVLTLLFKVNKKGAVGALVATAAFLVCAAVFSVMLMLAENGSFVEKIMPPELEVDTYIVGCAEQACTAFSRILSVGSGIVAVVFLVLGFILRPYSYDTVRARSVLMYKGKAQKEAARRKLRRGSM